MAKNEKRKGQEAIERFDAQRKAGIGHNSVKHLVDPQYQDILHDCLTLMDNRDVINSQLQGFVNMAKERGYSAKATRSILQELRMNPETRNKLALDRYHALGASGQNLPLFERSAVKAVSEQRSKEAGEDEAAAENDTLETDAGDEDGEKQEKKAAKSLPKATKKAIPEKKAKPAARPEPSPQPTVTAPVTVQ